MIRAVTFADSKMSISADKLVASMYRFGADLVYRYGVDDLPADFMERNKELFEEQDRLAWYVWKPWAVKEAMSQCEEGDILIYADSGQEIVAPVQQVINCMQRDIMLFSNGWPELDWTKADVVYAINPDKMTKVDTFVGSFYTMEKLEGRKQVQASLIFLRVSEGSRAFIDEWYELSQVPGLIDNSPSKLMNWLTFAEHRWDQSLLSQLAIKYEITLHWFPVLTGFHLPKQPGDHYGAISDHHRKRNSEW